MSQPFVQIEVRAPDTAQADRLLAEAYAAGAAGCEEQDLDGGGKRLLLYVEADRAQAVGQALGAVAVDSEIGPPEPVPERDWSKAWRDGLGAIVVSPRLVVRPSFVAHPRVPGQETVLIDPGQAFGTGEHESTRLALELLDAWLPQLGRQPCVLDAGTGSGVLAIAAAKLGARAALGFDLDPVATDAARENVRQNGVVGQVEIVTGEITAVPRGSFDLVIANLLRRELAPILPALAARIVPGGVGIFTGLLESDRPEVSGALEAAGLGIVEARDRRDARGDTWIGLVARIRTG